MNPDQTAPKVHIVCIIVYQNLSNNKVKHVLTGGDYVIC